MRTTVRQVRYLGSAKSGTHHVWHMRLTSLALVPLTIGFVWIILSLVGKDYNTVRAALGSPAIAIIMLLFLLAGIYHMMLGMQTVIEDYIHGHARQDVVADRQHVLLNLCRIGLRICSASSELHLSSSKGH